MNLVANSKQSYDVDISLRNTKTAAESSNFLDLKNPLFRYTGQPPQPPPGAQSQTQSPTENFWGNLAQSGTGAQSYMQNGYGNVTQQQNNVCSFTTGGYQSQNVAPRPAGQSDHSLIINNLSPTAVVATQGITSGVASMSVNTRAAFSQPFHHSPSTPSASIQLDNTSLNDLLVRYPQHPSFAQQPSQSPSIQSSVSPHLGMVQNAH